MVYVTDQPNGRFHVTAECHRLRAGQAATKSSKEIYAITLDELERRTPCRRCFPDAPHVSVHIPYCSICDSSRPCAHNGGVLVYVPTKRDIKCRYVRPERARFYEQVIDKAKVQD